QACHWNVVVAGDQARSLAQWRKRDAARSGVADIGCAQREKPAPRVECQFEFRNKIAALIVADKTFRAGCSVLHRAAKLPGRPQHEAKFDIDSISRSEIAADVKRQDANPVRIDAENSRQLTFLSDRPAAAGINRVAIIRLVV